MLAKLKSRTENTLRASSIGAYELVKNFELRIVALAASRACTSQTLVLRYGNDQQPHDQVRDISEDEIFSLVFHLILGSSRVLMAVDSINQVFFCLFGDLALFDS